VRGVPAPFATAREVAWKEAVRECVLALWGRIFLEEPCEVLLRFILPPAKAAETDIDNLLKPCIDALGSVLFRPARRGHRVIWNADDHWIYRLVAEKRPAESLEDCGVEITVTAHVVGEV
jgi:Holliday junction resolvase RusA-like endonuclease